MKFKFSLLIAILCSLQSAKALSITVITTPKTDNTTSAIALKAQQTQPKASSWAVQQKVNLTSINDSVNSNQQIINKVWQIINNQLVSKNFNLKTPKGKEIHNQGIQPNYITKSKDSQYQQAINILIRHLNGNKTATILRVYHLHP